MVIQAKGCSLHLQNHDNKPKLILKNVANSDDLILASHRSHRSHSSHRSHYSSRSSGRKTKKTPEVKKQVPSNPTENTKINTGDLGKFDSRKKLYIHERKDNMIIVSGENIFPTEI